MLLLLLSLLLEHTFLEVALGRVAAAAACASAAGRTCVELILIDAHARPEGIECEARRVIVEIKLRTLEQLLRLRYEHRAMVLLLLISCTCHGARRS